MVTGINISLSGMNAATDKLNASASNIANARTTGSLDDLNNGAYEAYDAVSVSGPDGSVQTQNTLRDPAIIPAFDPNSPLANEDGLVGAPNVNYGEELTNAKAAEMSYKANAEMLATQIELSETLLDIFDDD